MLTDEQLAELRDRLHNPRLYSDQPGKSPYWHDGFGMNYILQRAYRLGLLRAAEICDDAHKSAHPSDLADTIRAEAENADR